MGIIQKHRSWKKNTNLSSKLFFKMYAYQQILIAKRRWRKWLRK